MLHASAGASYLYQKDERSSGTLVRKNIESVFLRIVLEQVVDPYPTFRYIYARVAQLVPMRRFMHVILFVRYAMQTSRVLSPPTGHDDTRPDSRRHDRTAQDSKSLFVIGSLPTHMHVFCNL